MIFLQRSEDGYRFEGSSAAVEDGTAWGVSYTIDVDDRWITRSARVASRSTEGEREVRLEADGRGAWRVDGERAPELAACLDVDLEASAFTNAFPVHRLGLRVGDRADAPAAYVRAHDVRVERLEQHYTRVADDGVRPRYDYAAPAFDFAATLVYDELGLVLEYPGIAVRMA